VPVSGLPRLSRDVIPGGTEAPQTSQVAMLYVLSSWVILQIIATLGSMLELPGWVGKLALLALGLGLPVALASHGV